MPKLDFETLNGGMKVSDFLSKIKSKMGVSAKKLTGLPEEYISPEDWKVIQSKKGNYYFGPLSKCDCRFRWCGPYRTKAEALEDMRGVARFAKSNPS